MNRGRGLKLGDVRVVTLSRKLTRMIYATTYIMQLSHEYFLLICYNSDSAESQHLFIYLKKLMPLFFQFLYFPLPNG